MIKKPPKNYAFIDSQNLVASLQKVGWKMDWRKFRRWLGDEYSVSRAYMFIGYVPEMKDLYDQMHEAGYAVVLKPTFDLTRPRQTVDKAGKEKPVKGNIDGDLVLWAMKELPNYDKAIIVSGDGDFYGLVEYLVDKGRLEKVLVPSLYFSGLFNRYKEFIERIDQHRTELAYHDKNRPRSTKS
ncbi:NYN domain-containing protein [Candidatus Saccharibacteria bacterium]|nr:NYN domain-containing protein [Candidatus Saccharibacteria bacterium]